MSKFNYGDVLKMPTVPGKYCSFRVRLLNQWAMVIPYQVCYDPAPTGDDHYATFLADTEVSRIESDEVLTSILKLCLE